MPEKVSESNRFELRRAALVDLLTAMSSFGMLLRAWWPALLWMLAIYIGSTDVLSSQQTSRFIGPFMRWLVPDISDAAIHGVQFVVRKCGHLTEYALLAGLFYRAVHMTVRATTFWRARIAAAAFALATLYAISDELHQGLVASRYGSAIDVGIDAAGAALGLSAIWLWHVMRQRAKAPTEHEPISLSEPLPR